jgi:hypothetical protein
MTDPYENHIKQGGFCSMTQFTITAKAKDIAQYNRDMSKIDSALRPLADKFGGGLGITNGPGPGKPAMLVYFNDAAAASAFEAAALKEASRRGPLGLRAVPALTLKRQ